MGLLFLSIDAIRKQLFYEFLAYEELVLSPGKQSELEPSTLLSSLSNENVITRFAMAERQLREHLGKVEKSEDENRQFEKLFKALMDYKTASAKPNNPFFSFVRKVDDQLPHPCAWMVFAPGLIDNVSEEELSFKTEESFIQYIMRPSSAFRFSVHCPIEQTGLYIAVKTANAEMVNAFLCKAFLNYQLTINELKKLLSLTSDPKTRLALLHNSPQLLNWLSADSELKSNVVMCFEELEGLWVEWSANAKSRLDFIQGTSSQLWLNLLKDNLIKQKVENLFGDDFVRLQERLMLDESMQNRDALPGVLRYLDKEQQFDYLINSVEVDTLYALPRSTSDKHWIQLLSSLGYPINTNGGLVTTRYQLPETVSRVHDELIKTLIDLPVDAEKIIKALKAVETFVQSPSTKKDYLPIIKQIDADALQKEYEASSLFMNFMYWLLRLIKLMDKSPLTPHLDRLIQVVCTNSSEILTGDLFTILPPVDNLREYNPAITALFNKKIENFWKNIPEAAQKIIIRDPTRWNGLLKFLSSPIDYRVGFIKSLDSESLHYLNSVAGMRQLLLKTPFFDVEDEDEDRNHMSILLAKMKENNEELLEDVPSLLALLLDDNKIVSERIAPFLRRKKDVFILDNIMAKMEKPLKEAHFERFLLGYDINAVEFSALLKAMHTSNPPLAGECWKLVPEKIWETWYKKVHHAKEWAKILVHLDMEHRIDFFDKLTSGNKLTAREFCALSPSDVLWEKIPDSQWKEWITDEGLPPTTKTLISFMPLSIKPLFFQEMLRMSKDDPKALKELMVTPDRTIDAFYPDRVKAIAEEKPTTEKTVIAKLKMLKKEQHDKFTEALQTLKDELHELDRNLTDLFSVPVSEYTGNITWFVSFFKSNEYTKKLDPVGKNVAKIQAAQQVISTHPLLAEVMNPVIGTGDIFVQLNNELVNIGGHLRAFHGIEQDNLPSDLQAHLKQIAIVFKVIEDMGVVSLAFDRDVARAQRDVTPAGRAGSLSQVKVLIDDLNNQFDVYYSTHMTRFFSSKDLGQPTQQSLARQLDHLFDCIKALESMAEQPGEQPAIRSELDELRASLIKLKTKHQSFPSALRTSLKLDEKRTKSGTLDQYLSELEVKLDRMVL